MTDTVETTLEGCTVIVTRERPGELARELTRRSASVVHVPLIEVVDAHPDETSRLHGALAARPDWVVVTSAAGAERVAEHVRNHHEVRTAAVGTATAHRLSELTGRAVDIVPSRQLGAALATEFNAACSSPQRVVVAQADGAGDDLTTGLVAAGHDVQAVTAYHIVMRAPSMADLDQLAGADAVLFASGSAARAWSDALGADADSALPPLVVAIGPTTAAAARECGLKVGHIAADHSLVGLIDTLVGEWHRRPRDGRRKIL